MTEFKFWKDPTFVSVDKDDGSLCLEWCFGKQAGKDSWRVAFYWDPKEGAYTIKTTQDDQYTEMGDKAALYLAHVLDAERDSR